MDAKKKHNPPNQLRNFRMEAGLSQSDVAFLLDIKNVGRISEWENGLSKPSIEHLLALGLIYERLPDQLYYDLRKTLKEKIDVRRKLLLELKEQNKGLDKGG